MAVELAANINATQQRVTLTEPLVAEPGDMFRIGDEAVEFGGYGRTGPGNRLVDHSGTVVSFERGMGDTTAVSHLAGVAVLPVVGGLVSDVTEPEPWGGGGGSAFNGGTITEPLTVDIPVETEVAAFVVQTDQGGGPIQSLYVDAATGFTTITILNVAGFINEDLTVVGAEATPGGDKIFEIQNGDTGDPIFRVNADGSVHIKTGTAIIADLP